MTITNENTENLFPGNGLTTVFSTNITAYAAEQIDVFLRKDSVDTVQTLTSQYLLGNLGEDLMVSVTMLTPPAVDEAVVVVRSTPLEQNMNITNSRAFDATVVETTLDLQTMMIQEISKQVARSFKVAPGILLPPESYSSEALDDLGAFAAQAEAAAAIAVAAAWTYDSRAEAEAATIAVTVERLNLFHNGLLLTYLRDAAGTALTTNGGTVNWSPVGPVYLEHYGATTYTTPELAIAATTSYTAEVQAAITATEGDLLFIGWVKIADKITQTARSRMHCPEGRMNGGFAVTTDFNMAATAITAWPLGQVVGCGQIGFDFTQDAAAASGLRADLVAYPEAMDISTSTRGTFDGVRIQRGIDGIIGDGNCGGNRFSVLELGCFGTNFRIDGALDFVHGESAEVWPFEFSGTANLTSIFYDGTTVGLDLRRCDGWSWDKWSSFKVKTVFDGRVSGVTQILPSLFNTLQQDGDGSNLLVSGGRLRIGAFYGTTTPAATGPVLQVSGGIVSITNANIAGAAARDILVDGGSLAISGGEIYNNSLNKTSIEITSGTLALTGVQFRWAASVAARSVPFVQQSSTGQLLVSDCRVEGAAAGYVSEVVNLTTDVAGAYVDTVSLRPHTTTFNAGWSRGTYITAEAQTEVALTTGLRRLRKIGSGEGQEIALERGIGTIDAQTAVTNGDQLGDISFSGWDGNSYHPGAYIRAIVAGSVADGVMPTSLTLLAADPAGALQTPLKLTHDKATITGTITGTAAAKIGPLLCTASGTANAIVLTYGVTAITAGLQLRFTTTANNTLSATIDLDGLGPVACKTVYGADLPANYIRKNIQMVATHNGTYWIITRTVPDFIPLRATAVADIAAGWVPTDKAVYSIGDLWYKGKAGAVTIADLPGLVPLNSTPDHFTENVTPGTTDMTSAIIAAIAYERDKTDTVRFNGSQYAVTNGIALNLDTRLIGTGRDGTSILVTAATGDVFTCDSGRNTISDLKIDAGVVRTADSFITTSRGNCTFDNVRMSGYFVGLTDRSDQGGNLYRDLIFFHTIASDGVTTGMYMYKAGAATTLVRCTFSTSNYTLRPLYCIRIDRGAAINFKDCQITGGHYGIYIGSAAITKGVGASKFTDCWFDNNRLAGLAMISDGKLTNCSFVGCWFGNNSDGGTGAGVLFKPVTGGTVDSVEFYGCQFLKSDYGFYASEEDGGTVTYVSVIGGQASQCLIAGFYLNGVTSGRVNGVAIGPTQDNTANDKGAILTGTFGTFDFTGNNVVGNTSAAVDVTGLVSGVAMERNYGVTAEDRGPDLYLGKLRQVPYCIVGGTADALTLTTNFHLNALATGQHFNFIPTSANTGAATADVDGIGATAIKTITGAALPAGYLRSGFMTKAWFDGTNIVADRLIERGSNSDGAYVKWADGTMRCGTTTAFTADATTASGAMFRWASAQTWTFPMPFQVSPSVSPGGGNSNAVFGTASGASTTSVTVNVLSALSLTARTASFSAFGRWY